MQRSKLYSILSVFDRQEQNRCRKYLISPYFNSSKTLTNLYDIFIKHINSTSNKELDKEKIWVKLYKNNEFDDVRFRKLLSDLLKLVEGFLAQQIYEDNPLHQATYLIDGVGKKKVNHLYNSTMKTARRLSNQQIHRPADYYFYQYKIEKSYYEIAQFGLKRANKSNEEEIANNLDRFYLAEKLRYYCSVLSQQYFISHEYKLLFIDQIIEHIKEYNYDDVPPVAIYFQIFLTLKEAENEQHYFKLKELLDKYGDQFPSKEAENIYGSALNYCIRKINQGNQLFLKELFDLHEDLLNKELIFVNGELLPWDFKNIIGAALKLGRYNWTEKFINDYSSKLPDSFRDNAVTYNSANLYFYQKKYEKVIELLREVEYEDPSYNLNSKGILLSTYYEMDEIEPLYSLLESFRAYLNRHKRTIPPRHRIPFMNLIKFIKKLTKIMPGDMKAMQKLKDEIDATKGIANLNWLKEKIAELE